MSELAFEENERVLAFHGPLIYEAKVIHAENWTGTDSEDGVTGPHYFVHYKGWKASWDEWVPDSRLMKLNEENKEKQKRLRELHEVKSSKAEAASGSSKDTASHKRKAADSSAPRAQKRSRETASTPAPLSAVETEEEWVKRPEIKLDVPDILKVQLVDDWEAITKNGQLVPLPRSPNVEAILAQYLHQYKGTKVSADLMREVCDGLQLYFSKCLGNNLLYRFERTQYADLQSRDVSTVYGAEHLLRLFVNLPELLAHTAMDSDSLNVLREALHDILGWLAKHHKKYFLAPLEAYENTSPAYQNLAKA